MLQLWQLMLLSAVITPTLSFNIHLCINDSVNVRPNSSGTIEYRYGQTSGSCTLTLRGFTPRSYVSLPGINVVSSSSNCNQGMSPITIKNKRYCVIRGDSTNQVMIHTTDGTLNLMFPSLGLTNFTIQFYNNVAICGQQVVISDVSKISLLSGVLASNYTFNQPYSSNCQISILAERYKNFSVQFKKLNVFGTSVMIGDETLDDGTSNEETFVVHSTNGVIGLTTENIDGSLSVLFIVKYTVLYCETNPYQINNSTFSPANGPWLVGSTVTFEYSCLDGFNLIGTNELSVECKEDGGQSMFEQRKDFTTKCVPVICDLLLNFTHFANGNISTTQDKYSYKEELKFECDDGYNKNGSVVCGDEGVWTETPECVESTTDEDNAVVQTDEMRFNKELATLLIPSIGGLVVLVVIIVVVVHFCLRKEKKPKAESTTALNASDSAGAYQEVSFCLERSNVQPRPPVIPMTSSQEQYDSSNLYSEVKVHEHENKKPWQADAQAEPVYETGPAVPPKLNQVMWEGNDMYESVAGAGEHQQTAVEMVQRRDGARQDPAVEMVDNDLYG